MAKKNKIKKIKKLEPRDFFLIPDEEERYYMVTDKMDDWHNLRLCVRLDDGSIRYIHREAKVIKVSCEKLILDLN